MKKDSDFVLILIMCLMAASSVGLSMNCPGVFYTPVSQALGVGKGTLSLYSTIGSITTGVATMVLPRILTEKNFKKVLITGMMCNILAIFMMSFSARVWHFYGLAVLMGAGNSCFSTVIITIIINSLIHENLGTKTGLVLSFSGVGGAVFNPILASVIENHGWRIGYRVMAAIMLLLCMPSMIYPIRYISSRKTDKQKRRSLVDGFMVKVFIAVIFLQLVPALGQHMIGIGTGKGLHSSSAAYMTSACMLANLSFKLLAGTLADRIGTKKTIAIMASVNIIGDFRLLFGTDIAVLLVGAFLYGAVYSISALLISMMCMDLYGGERYREAYPVVSFVSTSVYAMCISVVGFMYDFSGSYTLPISIATSFMAIHAVLAFSLYRTKAKQTA
ncbi:MAG: MFS transporter [Erysipelotrichaceae bacterium]|nr:MFS transporter [Erysipelotrichaceae bacterium]